MPLIQRKGIDQDPVKPYQWATLVGREDPVEILSYPIPAMGEREITENATIMVRLKPGDPTTLKEVPFNTVAVFSPDRHPWWAGVEYYDPNNPTVFQVKEK